MPQRTSRKDWFGSHSIDNYVLAPAQKIMKAVIVKTEQKNKTFYTSPQMEFKQDITGASDDFCSKNPNSKQCKAISKKM